MLKRKKIAIVGAGNMAEAIVAGLLKKKAVTPRQIFATDVDSQRLAHFRRRYNVHVGLDNRKTVKSCDITILAVKPQVMNDVIGGLNFTPRTNQIIITVAAGVAISTIIGGVHRRARVVRAMPNTTSMVMEGATALAGGPGVTGAQMKIAQAIFEAVGRVVVVDESQMDAVTGLSGGGVAYVYAFIEALADGGVNMGLSRAHAQLLAAQTVLGAATMVLETTEHPGSLKDRVASPGGATIAGLHQLENGRFRGIVMSAVESAAVRCRELGRQASAAGATAKRAS